eukprot:3297147-Amphidinium_carterae.1
MQSEIQTGLSGPSTPPNKDLRHPRIKSRNAVFTSTSTVQKDLTQGGPAPQSQSEIFAAAAALGTTPN